MSDSIFNAEQFLDQAITDANDTKVVPVPEGEDYLGIIEDVKARAWSKDGQSGVALDVLFNIEDVNVKAVTGRDKVTVKYGFYLDVTPSGSIDMGKGKNIKLGRLREALGLNIPGQPFSFGMMKGRMARLHVTQRPVGEDIYNDVKSVKPA